MKLSKMLRAVSLVWLLFFGVAYAASDPTVYVTRTGKKYHSAGCSYLKKSSIPMKLSEAVNGYTPCSRCNPPRVSAKAEEVKAVTASSTETTEVKSNEATTPPVTGESDKLPPAEQTPTNSGVKTWTDNEGTIHVSGKGDGTSSSSPSSYGSESAVGTTPSGRTTHVGPRGGVYHYSSSGKKVYHKRK